MSDFTTNFQFGKPTYRAARYDEVVNDNFDKLDAALKSWVSGSEPGSASNYDEIALTEGIVWRDSANHLTKVYGASSWETLFSSGNTHAHSSSTTGGQLSALSILQTLSVLHTTGQPILSISNNSDTNTYDPKISFKTGATLTERAKIFLDDSNNDDLIFDCLTASSVIRFQVNNTGTDSVIVETDGILDLYGQTITEVLATGSTDLTDWITALLDGSTTDADTPKNALQIKVGGTTYFIPCFTTV